jgi:hypothetical protein
LWPGEGFIARQLVLKHDHSLGLGPLPRRHRALVDHARLIATRVTLARHSGARAKRVPGIHDHCCGYDSHSRHYRRLAAMTTEIAL